MRTAGKLNLLTSSMVCKPWSRANPKRHKSDPCVQSGVDHGVDTFHHTRDAIGKFLPDFFVLENVDGVGIARSSDDKSSPLTWMVEDPKIGLSSLGYSVATVRQVSGTAGGLPQSRPRTLIFGARATTDIPAAKIVKRFQKFMEASGKSMVFHINTFLQKTIIKDNVPFAPSMDDHIEYLAELSKCMKTAKAAYELADTDLQLPLEAQRPSAKLQASARVRATIDVGSLLVGQRARKFLADGGQEAQLHGIADVNCSIERLPITVDGTIPTLTTSSALFSYKLLAFIHPEDLMASMGYPRVALNYMTPSSQRSCAGNGYIVSVSACALAAVATFTGHLVKQTKSEAKSSG